MDNKYKITTIHLYSTDDSNSMKGEITISNGSYDLTLDVKDINIIETLGPHVLNILVLAQEALR